MPREWTQIPAFIQRRFALGSLLALLVAILTFGVSGMSVSAAEIRHPQFSGDGKSLFFDVCTKDTWCVIHVYDLETQDLAFYQPPPGKVWMMASPSRAGDKLAFIEFPEGDPKRRFSEIHHDILPQAQVMVMNTDGSGPRALTSQPGLKTFPSFSRSGNLVLFNQAGVIRDTGKTVAAKYDLWEVEVATGKTRMFAGPFEFYGAGRSYYVGDGPEVLGNLNTPLAQLRQTGENPSDYLRRTKQSGIFSLKRGASTLADPLFTDVSGADHGCLDDADAVFHDGDHPKKGWMIWRRHAGGVTGSWPPPPRSQDSKSVTPTGTSVSPDGRLFAMGIKEDHGRARVGRLWLLGVESGEWREIVLPPSARLINQ